MHCALVGRWHSWPLPTRSPSPCPLPQPVQFDYSTKTAATMTALMALALVIFMVAQNRWSWHLIGSRRDELLDEALPQPPPVGLPWDWHRRPQSGPSITVSSSRRCGGSNGLEKSSGDVVVQRLSSEAGGGGRGCGGDTSHPASGV